MSVMENFNFTSDFIFSATERELLTLSLDDIVRGLMADYKSFSRNQDAGINIPKERREPRMSHSCILYAEGLRLAHTHLELAKKLVLASLFDCNEGTGRWVAANGDFGKMEAILKKMVKAEDLEFEDKLLLASVFGFNARIAKWLAVNGEIKQIEELCKLIAEFEARKAAERKKSTV